MGIKLKILFFCSAIFFNKNYSQNLVPNFSLERADTSICPPPFFASISGDLAPWMEYSSADCLNSCDTSNYLGVPINRFGYQNSLSGNGYVGLIAYDATSFNREYIEVQLTTSLVPGQLYYVQFYMSLADTMQYAIENLGALFTDTLYNPYPYMTWATGIPQVENSSGILNDKINWKSVTDSFVAVGGEKYISIGNFSDDASTVKQYFGGTTVNTLGAYYYIDDVYVGTTLPPVGIHEIEQDSHAMKLYPNPNKGSMILECNLADNEAGTLFIYDLTGKLMSSYLLSNGTKSLAIDAKALKPAAYLYEIMVNGKTVKRDKLTIIK